MRCWVWTLMIAQGLQLGFFAWCYVQYTELNVPNLVDRITRFLNDTTTTIDHLQGQLLDDMSSLKKTVSRWNSMTPEQGWQHVPGY